MAFRNQNGVDDQCRDFNEVRALQLDLRHLILERNFRLIAIGCGQ